MKDTTLFYPGFSLTNCNQFSALVFPEEPLTHTKSQETGLKTNQMKRDVLIRVLKHQNFCLLAC